MQHFGSSWIVYMEQREVTGKEAAVRHIELKQELYRFFQEYDVLHIGNYRELSENSAIKEMILEKGARGKLESRSSIVEDILNHE